MNVPTHTLSWWNSLKLSQQRKSSYDVRVEVNWQAQSFHTFSVKIGNVKFASSLKLPGFCAGTAQKLEETESITHTNLVMQSRRITKFSTSRTNLVCNIVTQSWCRTVVLIGL